MSEIDPAEVANFCACTQVRKTARAITQLYDEIMRPAGLKATQFSVLVAVSLCGDQGVAISRLGEILVIDRTSLTRILQPLAAQRLLRISAADDRRVKLVTPTARGRERLAEALRLWKRAQKKFLDRVGETQWTEVHAQLKRVTDTITQN